MFTSISRHAALLAMAGIGCTPRPSLQDLPPGLVAVGNGPALAPVLDAVASWKDTRIANAVAAARPKIDACNGAVSLILPDDGALEITCGDAPALAPLHAVWPDQPGQALIFALPDRGLGRATGALRPSTGGGFRAEIHSPAPKAGSAWDLLLPAAGSPGPWRLSADETLIHARILQDRSIDIPALIGDQNQGQTLFHLQSGLFSSAVLDRSWELAIYTPAPDGAMPRMALAVGVRSATLAQKAAEDYVATLGKQWTFQAEPVEVGGQKGGCLRHLNLLPELEPCYAITADSLVIAWNQGSLAHALTTATGAPEESGARIDFSRFPEADSKLGVAFAEAGDVPTPVHYPWKTVQISAGMAGDEVIVHLDAAAP